MIAPLISLQIPSEPNLRSLKYCTMASSTDATSHELLQIEAAAAAKGLPRIDEANASQHKPEDLRLFQDAGERARLDAPPRLWYWQMTGAAWNGTTLQYNKARQDYKKLMGDNQRRVRQRRESDQQRAAHADGEGRRRHRANLIAQAIEATFLGRDPHLPELSLTDNQLDMKRKYGSILSASNDDALGLMDFLGGIEGIEYRGHMWSCPPIIVDNQHQPVSDYPGDPFPYHKYLPCPLDIVSTLVCEERSLLPAFTELICQHAAFAIPLRVALTQLGLAHHFGILSRTLVTFGMERGKIMVDRNDANGNVVYTLPPGETCGPGTWEWNTDIVCRFSRVAHPWGKGDILLYTLYALAQECLCCCGTTLELDLLTSIPAQDAARILKHALLINYQKHDPNHYSIEKFVGPAWVEGMTVEDCVYVSSHKRLCPRCLAESNPQSRFNRLKRLVLLENM